MTSLVERLAIVVAVTISLPTGGQAISTGGAHTCALDSTGAAYCWGDNSGGQIGDGIVGATLKYDVAGLPSNVATIAAGMNHVCAATSSGSALCWGNNESGQLGDGTLTTRATPAPIAGLTGVRRLALGQGFSCALTSAGGVRCWGMNSSGQLGDGTTQKRATPVDVVGLSSGVQAIAAGDNHACALSAAGGVKCWGRNDRGQLGDGTTAQRLVAVDVAGLGGGVTAVAAGESQSCAIDGAGGVKCWGGNDGAQLGDGTSVQRNIPVAVVGLGAAARKLAMAYRKTCALTTGGVTCWGSGGFGGVPLAPVDVVGLTSGVADIGAGRTHFCAVTGTGAMKCWHSANTRGELGDGTINGSAVPVEVVGVPTGIQAMALGGFSTCALLPTNSVRCWGYNFYGQLGVANTKEYNVAGRVPGLDNVTSIAAGHDHTCAVASGAVKCWGGNGRGQLGDGTSATRGAPGDVVGLASGARSVQAGNYYSCAVTAAGGVKCWGVNQLTPLDIGGLTSGVAATALGSSHTCALLASGGVRCWGSNSSGQLGNATTSSSSVPVDVIGLASGVAAIVAGSDHNCALTLAGAVKCWGDNSRGQLGDGASTSRSSPVDAAQSLGRVKAIGGGLAATCAITESGAAWCWGAVPDQPPSAVPSQPALVPSLASGVSAIDLGEQHTCALLDGGGVNCFGVNNAGQVGDGTKVLSRRTSQSVVGTDSRSFLDLTPGNPLAVDKLSPFVVATSGTGANVNAKVQFRPQDLGTTASIYVFALVPPSLLVPAGEAADDFTPKSFVSKDAPVPCVLAQLTSSGELQQVSSSNLQAYLTGVLTSQGQSVAVLNGAPASQLAGATFYVGYGPTSAAMLGSGTNRSVANVGVPACQPQPPQTGWWWNPLEGGRGFSIESVGSRVFFAAFHYDVSGRATWNVASGATSLDGSLFSGELLNVTGGQTLGGPYPGFPAVSTLGPITLAFSDASHGTMIWPGGTVAIERMNLVPGGLAAAPQPNQPESGWWWNAQESGRGFFIEWQKGYADLAGYMYDDAGNPVWYISVFETPNPRTFSGAWWLYANGQSMNGAYRPATQINSNVAPVTIQFSGPDTAVMTLPNGRATALTRQRF